tara:strand:+ start:122 stop:625 length:504 start_codon:yes stop_codon:yes gene_type:complete
MYTIATLFIFSVIVLSIYFQFTKKIDFKINFNNQNLLKIVTKKNPSFFIPTLFISINLLIAFLGVITNSAIIAMFTGGTASLAFDPAIMAISFVSGAFFKDFKNSIICILSTAFIVCLVTNILMPRAGIFIFLCRFDAMLLLSSLAMLGRAAFEKGSKQWPTPKNRK